MFLWSVRSKKKRRKAIHIFVGFFFFLSLRYKNNYLLLGHLKKHLPHVHASLICVILAAPYLIFSLLALMCINIFKGYEVHATRTCALTEWSPSPILMALSLAFWIFKEADVAAAAFRHPSDTFCNLSHS